MQFYTQYCTHCLEKFCPDINEAVNGRLCFFIPTMDELERHFFVYVSMSAELVKSILNSEKKVVDVEQCADILHVEEGHWPSLARQEEIRAFYSASISFAGMYAQQKLVA
jgi:hypothetical protein